MTESKIEIEKHELQPVYIVVQSDQTDSYDFLCAKPEKTMH